MDKNSYLYILASKRNGTLYVGATTNLIQHIWQHKNTSFNRFTSKYAITRLVYYEAYNELEFAFEREKRLKAWKRAWKIELIEKMNPYWNDLYNSIL